MRSWWSTWNHSIIPSWNSTVHISNSFDHSITYWWYLFMMKISSKLNWTFSKQFILTLIIWRIIRNVYFSMSVKKSKTRLFNDLSLFVRLMLVHFIFVLIQNYQEVISNVEPGTNVLRFTQLHHIGAVRWNIQGD